ncbi:MAG: hypothetical protein R6U19_07150, partial [Bacteroidales bacterium]
PGDEITPFYHQNDSTLYFSSDWHAGLGGFDIFKSKGGFASWGKPENLGFPVNTSSNDLYYTINENGYSGYLSSNRPFTQSQMANDCCNNIYYYEYEPELTDTAELPEAPTDSLEIVMQQVRQQLPLTLYFENDLPTPSKGKDTTEARVDELLQEYAAQEQKYLEQYLIPGNESYQEDKERLKAFFRDVRQSRKMLDSLLDYLFKTMKQGEDVHLVIKGYASPLAGEEYNLKLSERRIVALINYLKQAENGKLKPFLSKTDTAEARLYMYPEPMGQVRDPKIGDDPEDKRNSIYNPAAARARKLVIKDIRRAAEPGADPKIAVSRKHFELDTLKPGESKTLSVTIKNRDEQKVMEIDSVQAALTRFSFHIPKYKIPPRDNVKMYIRVKCPEKQGPWSDHLHIYMKNINKALEIRFSGYVKNNGR